MSTTTAETYLTANGLAAVLGVSKWTVYRNYKQWPHSPVGGSIRFSPDDVADIKALIRVTPSPTEATPAYTPAELARARKRLGLPDRPAAT